MALLIALLNGHQVSYIVLCYLSLAVAIGFSVRALWLGWRDAVSGTTLCHAHWDRGLAFLLALGATVVLFRLPNVLTNRVLEPDECGHIAAGWSLLHDPVPWRGSDHGSSGPINSYVLSAAFAIGLPVNLMTSRIVLVTLLLILIGCTYATLVKLGGQLAAVLPALALGLFACLAGDVDHTHYNSESVSVALLAGALLLYVLGRERSPGGLTQLYGAGLLLGAIPYAKLQAAPPGCWVALVFIIDLWRSRRAGPGGWPRLLAFGLGGVSVPLLVTVVLLATGTWHDFTLSYLGFARSYGFHSASRLIMAASTISGPDMPWFLLYCFVVVIGLFCCLDRIPEPPPRRIQLLLGALLGYFAVSVFAVQSPKTGFSHYAALVLHPVALLLGVCVSQAATLLAAAVNAGRRCAPKAAVVWVSAATLALVAVHVGRWRIDMPPEEGFLPVLLDRPGTGWVPYLPVAPKQDFPVARYIAGHARAGDRLSVWGWASYYYVFAGVPNATRYPATILAMPPTRFTDGMGDELRAYYRQRYLGDLRRAPPTFFVDAVSSAESMCRDRQRWGHETWPELARFIAENYVKVFEGVVTPGDGTRVYLLREQAPR
jgi:hypothetical protein